MPIWSKTHPKKMQGITILELLLVLVVGAMMIYMGLRMFQSYQRDTDAQRLRYNINLLFQGLNNFYRANCIQYRDIQKPGIPNSNLKIGVLDPDALIGSHNLYVVDIKKNLKDPGFINEWPLPFNYFVDSKTPNEDYILQFNHVSLDRTITKDTTTKVSIGKIHLWKSQVAVKLREPNNAKFYQNLLGATCISKKEGNSVVPCARSDNSGNYLVWERLPAFGATETTSDLWPSTPELVQFMQMYTTYPILDLTNQLITNQSYLCGG